jgi:NitT/TauT family transport system substrate-binding protein
MEKGEIDAIFNSDPVMTKTRADNASESDRETRTSKGTQELFGGPYPGSRAPTQPADFIAKNPNTIQAPHQCHRARDALDANRFDRRHRRECAG